MRGTTNLRIVGVLALGMLAAGGVRGAAPGEQFALLVGVRQYEPSEPLPKLAYPEDDMNALARVLIASGYKTENIKVMTRTEGAQRLRFLPTADKVRKELALTLKRFEPADSVIVALAGHGARPRSPALFNIHSFSNPGWEAGRSGARVPASQQNRVAGPRPGLGLRRGFSGTSTGCCAMTTVSIELDKAQARRLRELATAARRSEQELCREAVEHYLQGRGQPEAGSRPVGQAALREMIGLVVDDLADASTMHDTRPVSRRDGLPRFGRRMAGVSKTKPQPPKEFGDVPYCSPWRAPIRTGTAAPHSRIRPDALQFSAHGGSCMAETAPLSEAAVLALRLETKGWRAKEGGRRLPAYRELAAAGLMVAGHTFTGGR